MTELVYLEHFQTIVLHGAPPTRIQGTGAVHIQTLVCISIRLLTTLVTVFPPDQLTQHVRTKHSCCWHNSSVNNGVRSDCSLQRLICVTQFRAPFCPHTISRVPTLLLLRRPLVPADLLLHFYLCSVYSVWAWKYYPSAESCW